MIATSPSSTGDAPERRPGRHRSARAHHAILDAPIPILVGVGSCGLSLEQVAACAGVGKTTIYRRWSSKHDPVAEAVATLTLSSSPSVETGDARRPPPGTARRARRHAIAPRPADVGLWGRFGTETLGIRQRGQK